MGWSKEMIKHMGPGEVILTNREFKEDVLAIYDKPCFVPFFDDMLSHPTEIARDTYWRAEFNIDTNTPIRDWNKHCQCQSPYNPSKDRQHYCNGCGMWFDIRCIGYEATRFQDWEPPVVDGSYEEILTRLPLIPVVRGSLLGEAAHHNQRWLVTGNGTWKAQAEASDRNLEPPQYEGTLDEAVVWYCCQKYWLGYTCPTCGEKI